MQSVGAGLQGRTILVCLALVAVMATVAVAQDQTPPRVEIYGGYQWQDPGAKLVGLNVGSIPKGYDVASTFFFNKYLGATIDSTAGFGKLANRSMVTFGPTLNLRSENVSPFFHTLVGLDHVIPFGGSGLRSDWGVGFKLGGGLDMNVSQRLAIRAIEADY